MKKRELRIWFSDFESSETNRKYIEKLLSRRYSLQLDPENPDYVVYSVFGYDYLSFENCVRICFVGENIRPDFNLSDYAFSYDWLDFEDRHARAPNFVLFPQWPEVLHKKKSEVPDLSNKPNFCNFIYTNANGHPIRDEFFLELNRHMPVTSFGGHLRNSTREISPRYSGDWSTGKVDAQRDFRFSIAFENSDAPGYTTEKLVHALAADTIPIYWGDPAYARVFNPDRLVDVRALGTERAIERVLHLEQNHDALLDVLNAPFFSDGADLDSLSQEALLGAFAKIFDRPHAEAFRRNFHMWGKHYEMTRRQHVRSAEIVSNLKQYTPRGLAKRVRRAMRRQLAKW